MNTKSAVGAAILFAAIHASPALATSAASLDQNQELGAFATEFGETLPPIGYVNFCATNAKACSPYSIGTQLSANRLPMSPDRWNMFYQVNTYVNGKILPVTDQDLYGVAERWAVPTTAGDCEDFVLLKKQTLEKLGIPPKNLQITVVLDERDQGHAVLTVSTAEGDFILDNRRNDILLWNDTNYKFLKRQSANNPRQWVSLLKKPVPSAAVASAQKP